MKTKLKTILGVFALTLSVGAAVGAGIKANDFKEVDASSSVDCTQLIIVDQSGGGNYRTMWLDNFGYTGDYNHDDLVAFVDSYYGSNIDNWDSAGTVRGHHYYGTGVNLCAGGSSGTYAFELPIWVSYCSIQFEGSWNDNKIYVNYLNNLSSENTPDPNNGHGKSTTFYTKNYGKYSS